MKRLTDYIRKVRVARELKSSAAMELRHRQELAILGIVDELALACEDFPRISYGRGAPGRDQVLYVWSSADSSVVVRIQALGKNEFTVQSGVGKKIREDRDGVLRYIAEKLRLF